jgi:hypothetical protein
VYRILYITASALKPIAMRVLSIYRSGEKQPIMFSAIRNRTNPKQNKPATPKPGMARRALKGHHKYHDIKPAKG